MTKFVLLSIQRYYQKLSNFLSAFLSLSRPTRAIKLFRDCFSTEEGRKKRKDK